MLDMRALFSNHVKEANAGPLKHISGTRYQGKLNTLIVSSIRFVAKLTLKSSWAQLHSQIRSECERLDMKKSAVPPLLAQMLLVSGEDHRHAYHPGFDVHAIGRALWRRALYSCHEGASTIEQQIVRVLTGHFEQTIQRKFREILLASLVAEAFSKSVLPALYLKIGYYGWRMNGFEQACNRLGLFPETMNLMDTAGLVARLKYPEPHRISKRRLDQIQRRQKYLTTLYFKHLKDGNYDHLLPSRASETFRRHESTAASARALPVS
jgi:membrane peptidoglycan carboxypeptidase